jgi:hypothetical protein
MRTLPLVAVLAGCQPDPRADLDQTVDYRDGADGGPTSGERGTVRIHEILWSGSVRDDGTWDPDDVFLELRNEFNRPVDVSQWHLMIDGPERFVVRIPSETPRIEVGGQLLIAARTDGCFPEPDAVIPDLRFPRGDGFRLTLQDADERLMDAAGDRHQPPFAGGYDLVASTSMERIALLFGIDGSMPHAWQFHARRPCPPSVDPGRTGLTCFEDVPNNDRMAEACRRLTRGSPGRANALDYSGAFGAGGFD